MSLVELMASADRPTISFEVFPARDEKAAKRLDKALANLVSQKPDFMSVTFGAGGFTRQGSYALVKNLMGKEIPVIAYFAGYGLGPEQIVHALDAYRDLGVDTILCIRGDEPRESEHFVAHPHSLPHASDLILFVGSRYDFTVGAAGYPEGHIQAESKQKDLEYLKFKVSTGAQFIIANYFYDNRYFLDFRERCRDAGIDVPILAGIMPIFSVKMMKMLAALCGASIPAEIHEHLAGLPPDDMAAIRDFGVGFAERQCRELIENGVDGLHFYTMNKSKSTVEILGRLKASGHL